MSYGINRGLLSLLVISAGAFVSCSDDESAALPRPAAFDLSLSVSRVSQTSAVVRVESSSDRGTYYCGFLPREQYTDDASLKLSDMLRFEALAGERGVPTEEFVRDTLCSGDSTREFSSLVPGVTYLAYAYQLTASGFAQQPVVTEEFTTTGYGEIQVGDFYMSDGTIVGRDEPLTDAQRSQCVGIVFYTGDPTSQDATLKREHPGCTHGLAVALSGEYGIQWCVNGGKFINNWVKKDGRFMEIWFGDKEGTDQPYNQIRGYNNTRALEAYNEEASPVDEVAAVSWVVKYRSEVALPFSTSDWYLPSLKEGSLLIAGAYDGDIFHIRASDNLYANREIVSASLEKADGEPIGEFDAFWSSTEHSANIAMQYCANGCNVGDNKFSELVSLRPIFAF